MLGGYQEAVVECFVFGDDLMDVEVFRMGEGVGLKLLQHRIIL